MGVNSVSRADQVDAEPISDCVNVQLEILRKQLFEVKKDKANLIKRHKNIQRQFKKTIDEVEDKNKTL